jgi:hypothetical protein
MNKASGGLLYKHLRHQGKPYRKRYGYPNNRTGIPNRIDIDQRSDADALSHERLWCVIHSNL